MTRHNLGDALLVGTHPPFQPVYRDESCTIWGIISIAFIFIFTPLLFFNLHSALALLHILWILLFFLQYSIGNATPQYSYSSQVWKTGNLTEWKGYNKMGSCIITHRLVASGKEVAHPGEVVFTREG